MRPGASLIIYTWKKTPNNCNGRIKILFILKKVEETILDFSQGTVNVL